MTDREKAVLLIKAVYGNLPTEYDEEMFEAAVDIVSGYMGNGGNDSRYRSVSLGDFSAVYESSENGNGLICDEAKCLLDRVYEGVRVI